MRQLHPSPSGSSEPEIEQHYLADERPPHPGRPWLALDMVASVDGATALAGRSGRLGSAIDRRVFLALRAAADVVLVGAGTARAEHYGPPVLPPFLQEARVAAGRPPLPRLAVASRSLDLDWDTPLFTDTPTRPLVITAAAAPPTRAERAREVAEVVVAGGAEVDLTAALAALATAEAGVVVCEGGPTLNGSLLAAGLVDEVCLTVAPVLASGSSRRLITGDELNTPTRLRLARVLEDGDELFLRYLRTP